MPIDRVLSKEHFYEKVMEKCALKDSPRSIFRLVNDPKQQLHARKFFKNKNIIKEDYQNALKELSLENFLD